MFGCCCLSSCSSVSVSPLEAYTCSQMHRVRWPEWPGHTGHGSCFRDSHTNCAGGEEAGAGRHELPVGTGHRWGTGGPRMRSVMSPEHTPGEREGDLDHLPSPKREWMGKEGRQAWLCAGEHGGGKRPRYRELGLGHRVPEQRPSCCSAEFCVSSSSLRAEFIPCTSSVEVLVCPAMKNLA